MYDFLKKQDFFLNQLKVYAVVKGGGRCLPNR